MQRCSISAFLLGPQLDNFGRIHARVHSVVYSVPPSVTLLSNTMRHVRWHSSSSVRSQDSLHDDVPASPCSDSSVDEDEINCRMKPFWPKYQATFKQRGFQLDTVKVVKLFYNQRSQNTPTNCLASQKRFHQDTTQDDDDSLCPDAGLVCLSTSSDSLMLISSFATPSPTIYSEAHDFPMLRESWSKPYMSAAVNMMLFGRCLGLP